MAQKRSIKIDTPKGQIFTAQTKDGNVTAKLEWKSEFAPKIEKNLMSAQEFVDSECIRYMNPLVPRLSGVLIKSGTLGTVIGSGVIEYVTPYARRQYYENAGAEGQRGSKWFERMKASHKEAIEKGANKRAGGN